MRFGGEDVVRHKLVQRIVERLRRLLAEPGPRAAPGPLTPIELELIDAPEELRAPALAALDAAGVADGHLAIELVDPDRIRELNREHRSLDEPTDVLSFPVDLGPPELGDVVICPEHTEDLDRGHRARRASPVRHGPRDRLRRDARAPGARHGALCDAAARASSRSPGGPTPASRRWSTRSWAARWRSSPTSPRPPAARSAAWPPRRTGSWCSWTCRACSGRAT